MGSMHAELHSPKPAHSNTYCDTSFPVASWPPALGSTGGVGTPDNSAAAC